MVRKTRLFAIPVLLVTGAFPIAAMGHGASLCSERTISASAVRTQEDIRAFVECAAVYFAEHGTEEARRAFHEDERWNHGSVYVFVDEIAKSGEEGLTLIYPPDRSLEGQPLAAAPAVDDFGTDLFYEIFRMMAVVDSGWTYYSILNPETGKRAAKASYIIKTEWHGNPAVIGAGIYSRDWPGTCHPDEVSAAVLSSNSSNETLRAFVRCAAMMVASEGYFATGSLESDPRWTNDGNYIYVLDMMGNQVISGSPVRVNGNALHEWGSRSAVTEQFGGRDMLNVGDTFGEMFVYYRSYDPMTGTHRPKIGFLKRVVAHGVPLLVGAGYHAGPNRPAMGPSCAEHSVTATAVRTQADVRAFVQCAAEYAMEHGEEEAHRAFNEDARWNSGPTYVFVDGLEPSGEDAVTHVFPPDPSREGSVWGTSIDSFGSDYFYELHRIMSIVESAWIYYAFTNPATGLREPKSSYVMEIDWNGKRASIGAGIYARDLPGTCDPGEVNAADLEGNPSDTQLREFVRCASHVMESSGFFGGPILSGDSRWNHGSIYAFVIKEAGGTTLFSSNPASFEFSGRVHELFDGRDMVQATATFGEVFWYYGSRNPASGAVQAKISFVKRVTAQGIPVLVGAGYNR